MNTNLIDQWIELLTQLKNVQGILPELNKKVDDLKEQQARSAALIDQFTTLLYYAAQEAGWMLPAGIVENENDPECVARAQQATEQIFATVAAHIEKQRLMV